MMVKLNPNHPYIPIVDRVTGKTRKVQHCAFVFCDPLTDEQIAMIEKDNGLIFNKVERGYFIAHYLDDAKWKERFGVKITMVYPPLPEEYPDNFSIENTILH